MLDKNAVITAAQQYANAVTQELSPASIVLFGSYVKGLPNDDSDIDVAVIFDGFSGDWLKTSNRLWRLIENVSFDIEPHMLDIKDDKSGFAAHIYKTGQIIYKAP
ncbi:MAG: nucleotidyltransferase domain-containing protein [Oscillospiraceae bacterium]|nr:nucleotidyltransferase domain-containing protein [Oscillospiraceae bacterium]